jgi:cytochrome bd-type quinol oxidase subunit 2
MEKIVLATAIVVGVAAMVTAVATLMRAPAERDARARLTPALVILTGGAFITFSGYLAYDLRCGHRCERGAGGGFAGLDRWWRDHDSWQWGAQLTIAAVGLAAAAVAFALAARGSRHARVPLWAARLIYLAWIALVFAVPAVYELVKS